MVNLMMPLPKKEVTRLGLVKVREAYEKLVYDYIRMADGGILLCPKCKGWFTPQEFYSDKSYATGKFPICKTCLLAMAEQRSSDRDKPNETKESVQRVLRMMNRVYDDAFYNECVESVKSEGGKRGPFIIYMSSIQTLRNWKDKTWDDSTFGDSMSSEPDDSVNENSRIIKAAKKRFGRDYTLQDLYFLESQYEDWVQRYDCETKAQEILFQRIAFTQLAIEKAQKAGKDTDKLDKTLQDLMSSNSIRPSQKGASALTEAKSFGQLIEKWEMEAPVPEPQGEFKDPDKIGLYIDVFFKGHLSKMMGLKNAFSSIYDNFMKKYTVKKPEYQEDADSEELFNEIFGSKELND